MDYWWIQDCSIYSHTVPEHVNVDGDVVSKTAKKTVEPGVRRTYVLYHFCSFAWTAGQNTHHTTHNNQFPTCISTHNWKY